MPMGIGIGLSITRGEGGGWWDATKAALKLAATSGAVPAFVASPLIPNEATSSSIAGTNLTVVTDTATRRTFGGRFSAGIWNQVRLDGSTDAQLGGGGLEFVTGSNVSLFEVVMSGTTQGGFRIWVDGQLMSAYPYRASGSGTRYFRFDFGTPAARTIRLEFRGSMTWGGIKLVTGQSISAPSSPTPLKMVVAGDSFTEGTGTIICGVQQYGYMGLVNFAGYCLGLKDIISSGSGGTGWAMTNGSRVALVNRYALDVVAEAPDVIVYAMGINDTDVSAALANAATVINGTRASLPKALIYVVGPWDSWAPSAMDSTKQQIRDGLSALCAGRGGIKFLDPTGVSFVKAGSGDTTHPSRVGHETLGLWLANQIRADIGLSALTNTRGPELVTNGDFGSATGWTDSSSGTGSAVISGGVLTVSRTDASNKGSRNQSITTINGQSYEVLAAQQSGNTYLALGGTGQNLAAAQNPKLTATATGASSLLNIETPTNGGTLVIDDVSVRQII